MLTNNCQNIYARIILVTQNLYYFTFSCGTAFWIVHDFHNYLLTRNCSHKSMLRDENISCHPFIIGNDECIRFLALKNTHDLRVRTRNHTHNFAFQTAASLAARCDFHKHDIPVHRRVQVMSIDIHVWMLAVIRNQECKALRMSLQLASH
ncbi:hypothetical protein D3C85_1386500 [compost metagenome]